jgi:hypothetical protein
MNRPDGGRRILFPHAEEDTYFRRALVYHMAIDIVLRKSAHQPGGDTDMLLHPFTDGNHHCTVMFGFNTFSLKVPVEAADDLPRQGDS